MQNRFFNSNQSRDLIDELFGWDRVERIRANYRKNIVATDDIHDAFAALWTAERIFEGRACVIPYPSPRDSKGLYMEMWY